MLHVLNSIEYNLFYLNKLPVRVCLTEQLGFIQVQLGHVLLPRAYTDNTVYAFRLAFDLAEAGFEPVPLSMCSPTLPSELTDLGISLYCSL